ncbi:MAG: transcription elongation factor GreA [Bacteroidia bacterium]|jgi:transcription elongation factor GreA|nr:transcription elongation factor GreA [Bacteroidia bacterium]
MSTQTEYFTKEGLQKLVDELHQLKTVERPSISRQIAEAKDKGDLSENAEYSAAKEAQGLLELRIAKLEDVLVNAQVVDRSKLDTSRVLILSKVRIKNVKNGATMHYTIVAENEANMKEGKISVNSPVAKGLLGKKVGQKATVKTPSGEVTFEVLEISL